MTATREASPYDGLAASLVKGRFLDLGTAVTTAPGSAAAMQNGYLFLAWTGTHPMIGVCWSSALAQVKYIPFTTKTLGRKTA